MSANFEPPALSSARHDRKSSVKKNIFFLLAILVLLAIRPGIAPGAAGRILNINTATEQQLQELPYIGETRARAIVKYRREHGPFQNLDQLLQVTDIGEKPLDAVRPYLTVTDAGSRQTPQVVASVQGNIATRPGDIIMLPDEKYFTVLVDFIKKAERSIDMTMFLFKTTASAGNKPALLVKELAAARKKGVDVRIVLENSDYDESLNKENRQVAQKLRKSNIQVFFDSAGQTTHAKMVVIDGRYCFVGSHNLSHSALTRNHEVSLLIDNRDLAAELVNYMGKLH
jgi:competence ComEA-like helix-hairpin-helix protein